MRCPACSNELTELQVGKVLVDVCQDGCGGIWFDAFELQRVDEQHEAAGEHLLHIRRQENLTLDQSHKRECPRCQEHAQNPHWSLDLTHLARLRELFDNDGPWLSELDRVAAERLFLSEMGR